MKRFIPYIVIVIIIASLSAYVLSECTPIDQPVEFVPISPPPLPADAFAVNEDGLIEIIFPVNIMGGGTAEDFMRQANVNIQYQEFSTDFFANEDGGLTLLLTLNQLLHYRETIHRYIQFPRNGQNFQSIKGAVFETETLTEITVWVYKDSYMQSWFDNMVSNVVVAMYAGRFQILSGIPPVDWHTTITVRDYATREIISSYYFPREDMYSMFGLG